MTFLAGGFAHGQIATKRGRSVLSAMSGHAQETQPFWVQKPQAAPDFERYSLASSLLEVEVLPNLQTGSRCEANGLNNSGTIVGQCGGDYYAGIPTRGYIAPADAADWSVVATGIHDIVDDGAMLVRRLSG